MMIAADVHSVFV